MLKKKKRYHQLLIQFNSCLCNVELSLFTLLKKVHRPPSTKLKIARIRAAFLLCGSLFRHFLGVCAIATARKEARLPTFANFVTTLFTWTESLYSWSIIGLLQVQISSHIWDSERENKQSIKIQFHFHYDFSSCLYNRFFQINFKILYGEPFTNLTSLHNIIFQAC